MTKAEEQAYLRYPRVTLDDFATFEEFEDHLVRRGAFIEGYQIAQKDMCLTSEDVSKIVNLVLTEQKSCDTPEEYYPKVAEIFNKEKTTNKQQDGTE